MQDPLDTRPPAGTIVRIEDANVLLSILHQYAYKWRVIGKALNFFDVELEDIVQSFPQASPMRLLTLLLIEWSRWPTEDHPCYPTVESLRDALLSPLVGLRAAADNVYELRSLLPSSQVHQTPPPQQPQEGNNIFYFSSEFSEDFTPQQLYTWLRSCQLPETDCRMIHSLDIGGIAFKRITGDNGWQDFGLTKIGIRIINLRIKKLLRRVSAYKSPSPQQQPYEDNILAEIDGSTPLDYQHQAALHYMITDLSPEDVTTLGQTLGIASSRLMKCSGESIHGEMVHMWLIGADQSRMLNPVPTWRGFAAALDRIGQGGIVLKIMTDHPSNYLGKPESASESLSKSEIEFCANIEKHMRSSGIIDRFLAHLVLVGFPASGKTSLIYRLLNLAISIEASCSTGVMDGIITVNIGEDKAFMHAANVDEVMEKCLWHKVEFSLSCLRQMGMLPSQPSHTSSNESQHRETTDPSSSDHDPAASDHGLATEDSQPMEVMLTTIQKTLQEKGYSADGFREILPYLNNKTTLYLSDTGGQVEFQELLPLLVAGCAIFLFLFPLNKDLDKPVRVCYRKRGGGEMNAYTSFLTIEESFLQTLSSIDSMQTSHLSHEPSTMKLSAHDSSMKRSSDFKHKPAVFVVGTHKDCLINELGEVEAKKKIQSIEKKIKELVTKHRYGELVMHADPAREEILFAVSNVDSSDYDFQRIRSRIMALIREEDKFHVEFPLSYLLASMHLDRKEKSIVKRSDFAKDVLQYGIKEEDIDHLLRFLHTRIGQIRYFPLEEIREDIVKEPQVLYDIVTNLITESFLLPGNVAQASEVKRGVYSFESFRKHSDFMETNKVVTLLRELGIVAPFIDQKSGEKKLFIPCVLNHLEEPAESIECTLPVVQPLAILFERGHCPKGMFGVLLHYIITQDSSKLLVWNLNIQKIFRDQVSFEVCPYNDEVTIKFHAAYLEVRYIPVQIAQRDPVFTEKNICNEIRSVLVSGIEQATKSLHYLPEKTKFYLGLVCTKCSSAHEVTKGYTIKCPKHEYLALPNSGSYWFKISTYSFFKLQGESDTVFLKKGSNCTLNFTVAPKNLSILHTLTKEGSIYRKDHVYLEQQTIVFKDVQEIDEGLYIISSRNEEGPGQASFQLKMKCPPKYIVEQYLEDVVGSSPTLPFSIDSCIPLGESTEHVLLRSNGRRAPGRFKVESDRIIFRRLRMEDSGEYIISCHDTEGELVQAILELEVMPSRPSCSQTAINFELNFNYPGVVFYNRPVTWKLTSLAATYGSLDDFGVHFSVPANSLSSTIDLSIYLCFSGPFELPDGYVSASPAYLIDPGKMEFQREVTIRMHHYARLQSEEDCADMAILSASSTPVYRESSPVYVFKEVQGAKGVFKHGDQVGEIKLKHFCFWKLARRIRKTVEWLGEKLQGNCLYSARLYRNISHQGEISAVFCMCLYHWAYIKHCDEVIIKNYTGLSARKESQSQDIVHILKDKVQLSISSTTGLCIKTPQILKKEIHIPELTNASVSQLMGYPPRLAIYVQQNSPATSFSESPALHVLGLDRECCFRRIPVVTPLPIAISQQQASVQMTTREIVVRSEDVNLMMTHLHNYAYKWREIGSSLNFLHGELENLKQSNPCATMPHLLTTLLNQWCQWPTSDHPHSPTMEKLCDTLRTGRVGLGAVADDLYALRNSLPSKQKS